MFTKSKAKLLCFTVFQQNSNIALLKGHPYSVTPYEHVLISYQNVPLKGSVFLRRFLAFEHSENIYAFVSESNFAGVTEFSLSKISPPFRKAYRKAHTETKNFYNLSKL